MSSFNSYFQTKSSEKIKFNILNRALDRNFTQFLAKENDIIRPFLTFYFFSLIQNPLKILSQKFGPSWTRQSDFP